MRSLRFVVTCVAATGVCLALILSEAPEAAQDGSPQITKLIVNGGAATTTANEVAVEVLYTHPSAPGAPIPFYRTRVIPPNGQAPAWGGYLDAAGRNAFVVPLGRRGMRAFDGLYEIQVQLRDAIGRESGVAIGHVTRATTPVAPSPTATAVDYRVDDAEVATLIGFARLQGYLNTAEPLNATSQCTSQQNDGYWHLRLQKLIVPVPLGTEAAPAPRCRFGFFKGKQLQPGWRLKSALLESWSQEPASWVTENAIKPSGQDAWFSIAAVATGAMGSGEIRLRELVFEGPSGSEWRKAFQP